MTHVHLQFFYMSEQNYLSTDPSATLTGKSHITVEWTNQHGCGGNEHTDPQIDNCDIIMQYMCFPEPTTDSASTSPYYPFSVWNNVRYDCTMECFAPRPDNPSCTLPSPACTLLPIQGAVDCALAGGLWLSAQVNDQYNCPHSCVGDETAGSAAACTGAWQNAPRRTNGGEPWPRLRDGTTTDRQTYTPPTNGQFSEQDRYNREWNNGAATVTGNGDVRLDRGLHEDWEWYDECFRRERNHGIFTADQNLQDNNLGYSSAIFTRQNPNGNRNGYECPEERDYYPYWHPSPWTDVAVLTDRTDHCEFYQTESQNVKGKNLCRNTANCPNCIRYNNEGDCRKYGGRWVEVGAYNVPPPICQLAPWTRDNHNGNTIGGDASRFNWTIPYLAYGSHTTNFKCVFRLRYNISTDDYDAWRVNASFNNNDAQGVRSPVQNNPTVNIGANLQGLRLAINTAQYGRTFQDRSHVFTLKPRPYSKTLDPNFFTNKDIYNINVRGKRGNIVQVYPAVEYDFIPNQLTINDQDLVHFQWTGSNTHNNGHPGGDGQTGDAGEGREGTDRHNVVELDPFNFAHSFPQTWEQNSLFRNMKTAFSEYYPNDVPIGDWRLNWALRMATVGYYSSFNGTNSDGSPDPASFKDQGNTLNPLLNNARASYEGGVFQFMVGSYNYMCTRNNNFSNRDQKGHILVKQYGS